MNKDYSHPDDWTIMIFANNMLEDVRVSIERGRRVWDGMAFGVPFDVISLQNIWLEFLRRSVTQLFYGQGMGRFVGIGAVKICKKGTEKRLKIPEMNRSCHFFFNTIHCAVTVVDGADRT